MPLDPDAGTVLEMVRAAGRPAYETVGPDEARAMFMASREVLSPEPQPVAETRALFAPRKDGGAIALRLYRGQGTQAGAALPVLVYFHGGGWVIGNIESHDTVCRHLANVAGCAVVSVEYRLAPEHKFPAAVEDCWDATVWVAEHADAIGLDPKHIAVGGDSAGGNLAAVVSLLARDRGAPRLALQLLIYPAVDAGMTHGSVERFAEGYLLTRATMKWFFDQYVRGPEDAADWRLSPLRAADLAGVAPAWVLTGGHDILGDEGIDYVRRLEESGVAVHHRRFEDQIHGFISMGKIVRAAGTALDEAGAALKSAFAAGQPG